MDRDSWGGREPARNFVGRRALFAALLLTSLSVAVIAHAQTAAPLATDHRRWLEEEVVYIITDRERDVFLSLNTHEERERLIEAFWRRRDPNPVTHENELKTEHYRRLDYANRILGRESYLSGWKTDRGHVYIVLGEPRQIQRFDTEDQIAPTEIWFYDGDTDDGLPPFFSLLFFKPNYVGDYELYDPVMDGPEKLVRGEHALTNTRTAALEALSTVSWELARAALTFDVGEPVAIDAARPSMAARLLVQRIFDLPQRPVRSDYAEAWLRDRNRVSADYSFNFVPNRSAFDVLFQADGVAFLNIALELDPQDFAVETDETRSRFYTTLDVTLEVRDATGLLVETSDKAVPVELTPTQLKQIRASPIAYHENFPVAPGDYDVSLVFRNRSAKQYTVAERRVHVPAWQAHSRAPTAPVLGYAVEPRANGRPTAFQVGGIRILPATDAVFRVGETVVAVVQAREARRVRFAVLDDRGIVCEHTVGAASRRTFVGELSLVDVPSGEYRLWAEAFDDSGDIVGDSSVPFRISPRTDLPRPALVRRVSFDSSAAGRARLAVGTQLLAQGHFDEARAELGKAVEHGGANLPMASWRLAWVYLDERSPDRALALLKPFESTHPDQYEVVAGIGLALFATSDFQEAIPKLVDATTLRPRETRILNALAESHARLGHAIRARELYQRSLDVDPDQPDVRSRLQTLDIQPQR